MSLCANRQSSIAGRLEGRQAGTVGAVSTRRWEGQRAGKGKRANGKGKGQRQTGWKAKGCKHGRREGGNLKDRVLSQREVGRQHLLGHRVLIKKHMLTNKRVLIKKHMLTNKRVLIKKHMLTNKRMLINTRMLIDGVPRRVGRPLARIAIRSAGLRLGCDQPTAVHVHPIGLSIGVNGSSIV